VWQNEEMARMLGILCLAKMFEIGRIGPRAAMSFALVLHEMATNAVKYGALSTTAGSVCISWELIGAAEEPRLRFEWREQGGPAVKPPSRKGFGSRLIEQSFHKEPQDEINLFYSPDGVKLTLEFRLKALQVSDS
jgi:two-component sensor histidine kinase